MKIEKRKNWISKIQDLYLGTILFPIIVVCISCYINRELGFWVAIEKTHPFLYIIIPTSILLGAFRRKIKKWISARLYEINRDLKKNELKGCVEDYLEKLVSENKFTLDLRVGELECYFSNEPLKIMSPNSLKKQIKKKLNDFRIFRLEGKSGSGKTHFLFSIIQDCRDKIGRGSNEWLPIFIEGRYMSSEMFQNPKLDMKLFLRNYFRLNEKIKNELMANLIWEQYDKLGLLILIDDLDQMAASLNRGEIIKKLEGIIIDEIEKNSEDQDILFNESNRFIITSRDFKESPIFIEGNYREYISNCNFISEPLYRNFNLKSIHEKYHVFFENHFFGDIFHHFHSHNDLAELFRELLSIDLERMPAFQKAMRNNENINNFENEMFLSNFIMLSNEYFKGSGALLSENTKKKQKIEIFLRNGPCCILFDLKDENDKYQTVEGYLTYIYRDSPNYKGIRKRYERELAKYWGEKAVEEFRNYLEDKRKDLNEVQFETTAINYIYEQYEAMIKSLIEGNIIETDESGFWVKKFKNYWLHKYYLEL